MELPPPPPPEMEPYVLYVGKSFMDGARREFGLGPLSRKLLLKMVEKLEVPFREIDRDEAKRQLDSIAQMRGVSVSTSDLIKNISLALFTPTTLLMAFRKKVVYGAGADLGDSVILELISEIPRAFRPSLIYEIWVVMPKSPEGAASSRKLMKAIASRVKVPPLTDEEWDGLEPIRTSLLETGITGANYNLWQAL
jgi:hypothetical protein